MKETYTRFLPAALKVLLWVGLALCFLAIAADYLGLGTQSGFGWRQIFLLSCGLCLSTMSWLLLRTLRGAQPGNLSGPAPIVWPSIKDTVIIFSLAVLITAVDIHFSQQLGVLAYPPTYDGVGYLLVAKSAFYKLHAGGADPAALISVLFAGGVPLTPLWEGLMLGSFLIFGEGEWQAYTIRFWPAFLLLLLVFWVIRRRACGAVAWMVVLFTSLLPIISVGLRTSGWDYFIGGETSTWDRYLDDLRPDLLFAVLLLWSVVPLIEHVRNLDRRIWLVSGSCGALAILVKSSTTPVLLLAGGLTVVYVLIVNRRQLSRCVPMALWGLVAFAVLLAPWASAGGASLMVSYLSYHLTVSRPLYAIPNATLVSEATYYWTLFPHHMGHWESWLLLGLGLVLWLVATWKKREQRDDRLLAYLLLAGALYGLVSATPNKNFFLGLPYYLLLWLFTWAVLAPFLAGLTEKHLLARRLLIVFSCLYALTMVGAGFYALRHWPSEELRRARENRQTTLQIAADLRGILSNEDMFMWAPAYGYPAALQYFMIDSEGQFPSVRWPDLSGATQVSTLLEQTETSCKVILVYTEDIEDVGKYIYVHPLGYPYWRALAARVKRPESPYRLVRSYKLWAHFPDHAFVIQLYVRDSDENRLKK